MHMLRNDDELFTTFGECYFSEVFPEKIKGWKCHTSQTQNLAVPVGKVKFIIFDNRVNSNTKGKLEEVTLGRLKNYKRLKIPPGLWYSFKCISKNKALIETTWLSNMRDPSEKDYDFQIKEYIENILKIKNYKIIYKEKGQIPLFYPTNSNGEKKINIGTAGKMTRLSTGYTFLNIQEHLSLIHI